MEMILIIIQSICIIMRNVNAPIAVCLCVSTTCSAFIFNLIFSFYSLLNMGQGTQWLQPLLLLHLHLIYAPFNRKQFQITTMLTTLCGFGKSI